MTRPSCPPCHTSTQWKQTCCQCCRSQLFENERDSNKKTTSMTTTTTQLEQFLQLTVRPVSVYSLQCSNNATPPPPPWHSCRWQQRCNENVILHEQKERWYNNNKYNTWVQQQQLRIMTTMWTRQCGIDDRASQRKAITIQMNKFQ